MRLRICERGDELENERRGHHADKNAAHEALHQDSIDDVADTEGQQDQFQRLPPRPGRLRDLGHALCLALAFVGCKHVSELQVASNASAATAAQTETHEVKSAGPEHIVMTVEEYEQLCPGSGTGPGALSEQPPSGARARPFQSGVAPPVPTPGQLIRRVTTVTDRGPSLDDLRSLSSLQSKVNTALQVKEEKKSGPAGLLGLLGSLWPVVLIGAAVLAGFVVWKLKPPWLSFLFKLLGRTP